MSDPIEQLLETNLKILDKLSQAPAPARQTDQSEQTDKLSEALAIAQGRFSNPDRSKKAVVRTKAKDGSPAGEYTYTYADLADIFTVIRKPLSEAGLAIVQDVRFQAPTGREEMGEAVVATTLRHSSGQWLRSVLRYPSAAGRIQDLGSIFTYLRRYSLSALIGIAPEEDDDGQLAVDAAREQHRQERKGDRSGKGDKSNAGDAPTEEQLAEFWAEWKALWPTRFHAKEEALAWLKEIDLNPNKANVGQLRSILSRLKMKKSLDGQADQAPPSRGGAAGKGKDAKPKLTPEEQRRQAIQGRWSILVGDKFKDLADKELATEAACWWAGVHYGWVRNPETQQEKDGRIWPTRPRATLTPIDNIKAAVDAIADLSHADVEEMLRDYTSWINDRLLELNPPAEGAQ